ncbi:TPA: hypothetical protein ACIO0H_000703 [Streptococcus agalactiae]|uniref:hypothetical protein n=1 Tax=Anaerococcus vaginalis TaxID=33037 RepID=UPI00290A672A|nr:hypothetical protein [Anaerococcus vaginalis]MDU5253195.1 hypothetical protein [Anaerococcus vaginalis]MDU6782000.1 hypothetical protein [Anaerococcus vaginalis]
MKNNYMKSLWQLAEGEHKALKLSIFLAVIGVFRYVALFWRKQNCLWFVCWK